MHESILYFVVRVRCRRKVSSRLLSHLLMSFLLNYIVPATKVAGHGWGICDNDFANNLSAGVHFKPYLAVCRLEQVYVTSSE